MKTRMRLGLGTAVAGVLSVGGPLTWMAAAGDAVAEPVTGVVVSNATLPGGFPGLVKGRADVQIAKLTVRPGASGGWHSHAGPSTVSVVSGTATVVTVHGKRCVWQDVPAGRAVVERRGAVHQVRNDGVGNLVLTAVTIVPHGADFGADEAAPAACRG